jgi:hypothetical protein
VGVNVDTDVSAIQHRLTELILVWDGKCQADGGCAGFSCVGPDAVTARCSTAQNCYIAPVDFDAGGS